jgi:uncharacterized RDD family membrane protein YckC
MLDPYAPPSVEVDAAPLEDSGAGELADRGTRLGAAILDGLLYGAVVLPGIFMASGFSLYDWRVFLPILALAIVQWYLIASRGQTLAKGWLRIRIVKMDGSPCGFVNGVVLRSWVMQLIGFGAAYMLGAMQVSFNPIGLLDVLFIFGAERRCLHDLIAGTKVIRV